MEVMSQSVGSINSLYVNAAPGVSGPSTGVVTVGSVTSLPNAPLANLTKNQLYLIAGGSALLLLVLLKK